MAALADVIGELENEDQLLASWAQGVALSNPLDAATIATARRIAQAAVRLDQDFETAGRIYTDLSNAGVFGRTRATIDLAGDDGHPYSCGPVTDLGFCMNRVHQGGCSAIPALARGEYGAETVRTYNEHASMWGACGLDGGDWRTLDGSSATLLDHIESILGQRVRGRASLFEAGNPLSDRPGAYDAEKASAEPAVVQRGLVWADFNSDDRDEIDLPGTTAGDVGHRLAQMRVPGFERFGREQDHRSDRRLAEKIGAAVEQVVEADALGLSYSRDDLRDDAAALVARYRVQEGV